MNITFPVRLLMSLTLFLTSYSLHAQESTAVGPQDTQMFAIWEMTVSPANMPKVIEAWKNAKAKMTEHQVPTTFNIMTVDDGRFLITSPIENLGQLDQDPMAGMAKVIGMEGMMGIFQPFYDNATSLNSYVIRAPKERSYFSSEDPREGANYRMWVHLTIDPSAVMKIDELAKKSVDLEKKYNSPFGYVIYRDELGMLGPKVIIEYWGDSTADLYQNKLAEMSEEYQKERKALSAEINELVVSSETFLGYYHADLSYEGPAVVAKKDE
ncbi:MAG: hypothetical protein AB8H47_07405 [Bacteroidia bacterium]